MRPRILLLVMACLLMTSSLALADTINVNGTDSNWISFAATATQDPATSGTAFWDNPSSDGKPPGNVGYLLSTVATDTPDQYYSGNGTGGIANNVYFTNTGTGQTQVLLFEVAGYSGQNSLYIYNINDPTQYIPIFIGTDSPTVNSTKPVVVPTAWMGSDYGLLLISGDGNSFYSGNTHNEVSADNTSNFAFFRKNGVADTWYVGIEDLIAGGFEGTGDFNDMVVKITIDNQGGVNPVPIPGAAWLLGSGLLGLLGLRRKSVA